MTTAPGHPTVSIILPIYNGAAYISDALDSIARQTYANWALIVVDDGSTDATPAVLDKMPPDARRQIIRQDNRGLARARNRGLAAAHGDYVAFLDADDQWQPTYLAQMCAALEQTPEAVAAFAGWRYMDAAGKPAPQSIMLSAREAARLDHDLYWRNALVPSALVVRRRAVEQAGGFDEQLSACADWDLWLRLHELGSFVAVHEVLIWYRAHADSMSEDVANLERERLRVHAKHLGSLDTPMSQWPAARRQAVGFTYFNSALGYLREGDRARAPQKLQQAVACWPGLLDLDEFYYELGCADQPRGFRGRTTALDLAAGETLIRSVVFDWLSWDKSAPSPQHVWSLANLSLSRLALATGQPQAARRYALGAFLSGGLGQKARAARAFVRAVAPRWLIAFIQNARQPSDHRLPSTP